MSLFGVRIYYKSTKLHENRLAIFEKMDVNFFLMWTTLNFKGWSKTKKTNWRYLQGDPKYRMLTRLISWFMRYVKRRTYRKLKTIVLVSGIFSGKPDSVILLGFECTINPQILIKIVRAIFEKIEIFNFLCELPLILRLGKNKKKGSRYLQENPRYRIWTRSVYRFRLYVRWRSHTHTHTHTHTDTHFF